MKTNNFLSFTFWKAIHLFLLLNVINNIFAQNDSSASIKGYPIVGTNQTKYYNNTSEIISPVVDGPFYGQNANYPGNVPKYTKNGDGTVSDLVTGLMWQQTPDKNGDKKIDVNDKVSFDEALAGTSNYKLGGYTDWRLPTIKELYSLILFSGLDVSGRENAAVPFIDTNYFDFGYGDMNAGERMIDAQFVSSTCYVDFTMKRAKTVFGVNFADGRIKGYGLTKPMGLEQKKFYRLYVRGNAEYGQNKFVDNGNGTITDFATKLMWMQDDSSNGMNWQDALSYAENITFAGYSDWRLPDAKELESIVDYSRSPSTTNSAAIDPLFRCSKIINEAGKDDYPCYWSSTTHANGSTSMSGSAAAYVVFGRGMGYMWMLGGWIDVHGAGCQRSDPKLGSSLDFPHGRGPQGDAIRIANYVRLVRTIQ